MVGLLGMTGATAHRDAAATSASRPVKAKGDGTVPLADRSGGSGNLVPIDQGHGIGACYGDNSRLPVSSGRHVKAGDVISPSGSTGNSNGPHAHDEILIEGVPVDSTPFTKLAPEVRTVRITAARPRPPRIGCAFDNSRRPSGNGACYNRRSAATGRGQRGVIAVKFETVIGLEVHAQLLTRSKMFCRCAASYAAAEPNTHVCPVCLGLPGALPVANHEAVAYTVMTGVALGCSIPAFSKFDRKNYIYPDLMKGYQISQYDHPFCVEGALEFEGDGGPQRVGIRRVHLEEDTARLVHRTRAAESYSLVDVNRSGVPLMEIVSEPDLHSPEDARVYLITLRQILRYLGVSTGNMEEGAFRCDANVSQRSVDGSVVGAKVEIKNMNSFRSVERALAFEVERQRAALLNGERIEQETRGWVDDQGVTVSQRTKEYAHDYRYFPEPDLPPVFLSEVEVAAIQGRMPELPAARRQRFVAAFGLTPADAAVLTEERAVADYVEACVAGDAGRARATAIWVTGEVFALMRERGLGIDEVNVAPAQLRELIDLVGSGIINTRTAKEVLVAVHETGDDPAAIVEERGLAQVSDVAQLRAVVESVIAANPGAEADFRRGKKAAAGFLLGQVMRQMRGTANPAVARQLLEEVLTERI